MKKRILSIIIFLVLLLNSFSIVFAEDNESENGLNIDEIKSDFGAMREGLDEQTENVLKKEINIKEPFDSMLKFLFGVRGETIFTLEKLVLSTSILVALFILIFVTLKFSAIFNGNKIIEIAAPIIVVILISISGGTTYVVSLFLDILESVKWLENLGPAKIFLGLVSIYIIAYAALKSANWFNDKIKLAQADRTANNIDMGSKSGQIASKSMDALNKK